MHTMLFDAISYDDYARRSGDRKLQRIGAFINFIERKLGVSAIYPLSQLKFDNPELSKWLALAETLQSKNIIHSLARASRPPDEPSLHQWVAICGDEWGTTASGTSIDNNAAALTATLAESIERYLWLTQNDYFEKPVVATSAEMTKRGSYIEPARFVSFSEKERASDPKRHLNPEASYLWVRGNSLTNGEKIYLPAQTVSAQHARHHSHEPVIRQATTIGLATWPTLAGARLAGALEVIEREAYMIMWYNQLTLPKLDISLVRGESASLDQLVARCERYRLKFHVIEMLTDAPTHAICVVLEDMSGQAPRFAVGLKAHRSLAWAIEKAGHEAMRAHASCRYNLANGAPWDPSTTVDKIGHRERIYYWAEKQNAPRLEFLVRGGIKKPARAAWDNDSIEEHLTRIITWCKKKNFECVSFSVGKSRLNVTPWYIEMIIMPDLQPTHLMEWCRQSGGERLKSVPQQFGYTPREKPFIEEPHPYS